jgi:hypothetical protein
MEKHAGVYESVNSHGSELFFPEKIVAVKIAYEIESSVSP